MKRWMLGLDVVTFAQILIAVTIFIMAFRVLLKSCTALYSYKVEFYFSNGHEKE